MTDSNPYDLIVIGGGPGGYVASIRVCSARNAGRLHRSITAAGGDLFEGGLHSQQSVVGVQRPF